MNQIERDLSKKLLDDVRRATVHYMEMCDMMDVPRRDQYATLVVQFAGIAMAVARTGRVGKETFLDRLGAQWDDQMKRVKPRSPRYERKAPRFD